jgi:restriction system protein
LTSSSFTAILFVKLLLPIFIFSAAVFIIKFVLEQIEKQKLSKLGIRDIDKLDGKTFEKYLEVYFLELGYGVVRTKYIGDYGADLVIEKNGIRKIVQAKRWKGKVGIKAVQEAVAAKGHYECSEALVVTNSFFTDQARKLAASNNVELWDRKKFMSSLSHLKNYAYSEEAFKEPCSDTKVFGTSSENKCALCGKTVSQKAIDYCRSRKEQFKSGVYCYDCQRKQ